MASRLLSLPDVGPAAAERVDRQPSCWLQRGTSVSLGRPVVLGILNVTPDSFSDGGRYAEVDFAVARAVELVQQGADLVDVGGESTRPGASPVDATEEWRRVGPVVRELGALGIPISVDTTKREVARRSIESGARVINDVSGLTADPDLATLAAETGAGLVIMHRRGSPRTMQDDVEYEDLIGEVRGFLRRQADLALERGCEPGQLAVDPGIGFGKSVRGSLGLVQRLGEIAALGWPVMIGPSRKSFIGAVLDVDVGERLEGTLATCVLALERGARLFRVHDVGAVRRALSVAEAIRGAEA